MIEYLKKLACGLVFAIVKYQGNNINGYPFYTERQDKKNMYQSSGVCVEAYDVTGEYKRMYYGRIQEIWEIDFHGFNISLFHCNWVDAHNGVIKDKYGFISVHHNHHKYKSEPFVFTKHVTEVFYVPDTVNKKLKVVIPRK
jgi:hypothetical protein